MSIHLNFLNYIFRKIGKKIFVNQALVLRNFQLTTSEGKNQHLYLLGMIFYLRKHQTRTERLRENILDSVLLSLVPSGTDNDVKTEGEGEGPSSHLIEYLQYWR